MNWLLLTLAFIVQEPISTSAILLKVYQLHYNLWLIHGLFVLATSFDIAVGYGIGRILTKEFGDSRLIVYLRKKLESFNKFAGERGMIAALILYSPLIFPVSAIFIPWLEVPVSIAILCIFIGELIFWYLYVWLLVIGANSFAANAHYAFYAVIIVAVLVSLAMQYFSRKKKYPKD